MKSVLTRRLLPEPPLRFTPYSQAKLPWIDRLM